MTLNTSEEGQFVGLWDRLAKGAYATAAEKGWWDEPRRDGELIALMHSELSEALEAVRRGNPSDDKIPEYSGLTAELADLVIRVMDMAGHHGLPIADAVLAKLKFNKTREHRHGGKEF